LSFCIIPSRQTERIKKSIENSAKVFDEFTTQFNRKLNQTLNPKQQDSRSRTSKKPQFTIRVSHLHQEHSPLKLIKDRSPAQIEYLVQSSNQIETSPRAISTAKSILTKIEMKLHLLLIILVARAFNLCSQVQASPVELSTSPTGVAVSSSTSSSNIELWSGNGTHGSSNKKDQNIADEAAPQKPPNDHTKLKVVGLVIIFIGVLVFVFVCYCGWKHKKLLLMLL
jgi:hypothetical protein